MEIRVERDEDTLYTVTVGKKAIITTWVGSVEELQLKRWIHEVQVIYGKRNRQNIVVGLCADRSLNYSNAPFRFDKGSRKDDPFELLQLCVGRHCLLYELVTYGTPKALRDFFYDRRTIVVGVGIEKTAAKLEKEHGILIRTRMELRDMAEADKSLQGHDDFSRHNVGRLARAVLGEEEGNFEKPRKIKWLATQWPQRPNQWPQRWDLLSDDMVKYATAEAFLVYEMGSKLLHE